MLRVFVPCDDGTERLVGEVREDAADALLASVSSSSLWRAETTPFAYFGRDDGEIPRLLDGRFFVHTQLTPDCAVVSTVDRPFARFYLWTQSDEPVPAAYVLRDGHLAVHEEAGRLSTGEFYRLLEKVEPRLDELVRDVGSIPEPDKAALHEALTADYARWRRWGVHVLDMEPTNVTLGADGRARFLNVSVGHGVSYVGRTPDSEAAAMIQAEADSGLTRYAPVGGPPPPPPAKSLSVARHWEAAGYPEFTQVAVGGRSYNACGHVLATECLCIGGKYVRAGEREGAEGAEGALVVPPTPAAGSCACGH